MSHYKPYPAYRDSGVEWLGRVPEHWAAKKLMYWISTGYGSGTTPSDESYYINDESGVAWVTTGELRENTINRTEKYVTEHALASHSALKVHPVGSLVIAMYGATIGRLGVLGIEATLNQACFAIHPSSVITTPFLRYWFEGFRSELIELGTGGGQPNVSADKIRNLVVPAPCSEDEQNAVTLHLDRETVRIDALVAKKTRFIELLREKRQALITHAVTKGLDPSVKMKDSGVEWLGEVPEHWEIRSVSSVGTKITNGYVGPTRDILVEDGVRYLQSLHIKGNQIKFDVPYFVTSEWSGQHKKSILEAGDVLIVQTGDIGQATVVTDEFAGCNCHALIIVSPDRNIVAGEWISWVFNSSYGLHTLLSIQTGAMHPHLNCGNVKDVALPVPPLDEQWEIIKCVEHEARRVSALIAKTERSIELIKERRSALITAAVTGQIDLREAA